MTKLPKTVHAATPPSDAEIVIDDAASFLRNNGLLEDENQKVSEARNVLMGDVFLNRLVKSAGQSLPPSRWTQCLLLLMFLLATLKTHMGFPGDLTHNCARELLESLHDFGVDIGHAPLLCAGPAR